MAQWCASWVLNHYFGAYFENADSSSLDFQLFKREGVWNRPVVKQSVLDDLDLPLQIVTCHLDKITISPWHCLATRIEVVISSVFILARPKQAVDNVKRERNLNRQVEELLLIEETEAREMPVGSSPQKNFVLNLVSGVGSSNLHVIVENIHIRFEDYLTNPSYPFAFGATLKKLTLEKTDSEWNPTANSEEPQQLFMMLSMEFFSIYWQDNKNNIFSKMDSEKQDEYFRKGIANCQEKPYENTYIVEPTTLCVKMENTRAELDGSNSTMSKISFYLELEELSIGLTPNWCKDMVCFLGCIERFYRGCNTVSIGLA